MQLSENFSLEEFVLSQTASRLGIDNTPPAEIIENLKVTAAGMEQVRTLLGHAILLSSGYRCLKLNRAIGSADKSDHPHGWCADFICPPAGTPFQIAGRIMASVIKYDQIIMEGTWVHISFSPRMRQQALTLLPGGGFKEGISA